MIPEAREVRLSRKDRKVLEACCRSPVTLQRDLKRARIVLLAADGRSTRSIAKEVGVQPRIVSLWQQVRNLLSRLETCGVSRFHGTASNEARQWSTHFSGPERADSASLVWRGFFLLCAGAERLHSGYVRNEGWREDDKPMGPTTQRRRGALSLSHSGGCPDNSRASPAGPTARRS